MSGFDPRISGVDSDHSTKWDTTTANLDLFNSGGQSNQNLGAKQNKKSS